MLDRLSAPGTVAPPRLAIDRVFAVKGRGSVVTGSLRGGPIRDGLDLRLVPGDDAVRVREVQVRGQAVPEAAGGRTAILVGGVEAHRLRRGTVLTADPEVTATSRVLVAVRGAGGVAPADRDRLRIHLGTDQAGALVVRGPREAIDLPDGTALAILRLDATIAAAPGDRFALRRPSPGAVAGGGIVLDAVPPRGVSRRRLSPPRAAALATHPAGSADARLELHGALPVGGAWRLAPDVERALRDRAIELVAAHRRAHPDASGVPLTDVRADLALAARRLATLGRDEAATVADGVVDRLVADGTLVRADGWLRDPSASAGPTAATLEAMDRLDPGCAGSARRLHPHRRSAGWWGMGEHVFAAGDATDFPVKQGGLGAQQADVAAAGIAALAGDHEPRAASSPCCAAR